MAELCPQTLRSKEHKSVRNRITIYLYKIIKCIILDYSNNFIIIYKIIGSCVGTYNSFDSKEHYGVGGLCPEGMQRSPCHGSGILELWSAFDPPEGSRGAVGDGASLVLLWAWMGLVGRAQLCFTQKMGKKKKEK